MSPDPTAPRFRPAPAGFGLRRPGWDDLDAVVDLYAAVSRARPGADTMRREDLRIRWLWLESLDDVLLIEAHADAGGDPTLVGYAAFEADTDPWTGELDLHVEGTVHPDWTGRGLAGFLLGRAEDRARLATAAATATAPTPTTTTTAATATATIAADRPTPMLRTSLVDGDDHARAWFAAKGFVPVRHLLELRLDLHAPPPAPAWHAGVHCRSFRPGEDEQALHAAHQAAFADVPTHLPLDLEDFLDDRLRRYPDLDPGLVLLAEHDDEVVGIAVCRAGTEVAPEDGWVRDLGVVPAWRRHGVGMALLRTAFAAFRERGLTGVALEVDDVTLDGAVALYRRAGMRTVRRTDVLERPVDRSTPA